MIKKIVKFFKRLKTKIHLKKHGMSYKDFQRYISSNLTLENIKRRDSDYNTAVRSVFNLDHRPMEFYFDK